MEHLCRRWWKRGFTCPFAPHEGEERPGGPESPTDDPDVRPPPALSLPERRRLRQFIEEAMTEMEGDTDAAILSEAIKRLGERVPIEGVAEEAIADMARDRVFQMPDIPELPAVPLVPRPGAAPRFGGGFFFDATQRAFGLMRSFPRMGSGEFGAGPPGTGPSGGGQGGV